MTITPKRGRLTYPFSYYGGKITLFKWIVQHLPHAHSFVDVFGGSGVMSFNVLGAYKRVVYNDLDKRMVNFFRVLRNQPEEFIDKLRLTPCAREEHHLSWEEVDDPVEQARRTFVKITQSFGKIGARPQRSGWLLPNKGSDRTGSILSRVENLHQVVEALRSTELECKPAIDLIHKENKSNTLLFADPPYVHSSRNGVYAYYHEMTNDDHADMCDAFNEVDSNVVLCGYENPIYAEKLQDWTLVKKATHSHIAVVKEPGEQTKRSECLWIKRN